MLFRSDDRRVGINAQFVDDGYTLHYVITVGNTTGSTHKFKVEDVIPEHTTYVADSASPSATYDATAKKLTWSGISIPAGEVATVAFDVKAVGVPDSTISIVNKATVWMLRSDDTPIDKTSKQTNEVINRVTMDSDAFIKKTVTDKSGRDINGLYVEKDRLLYYHLEIKNPELAGSKVFTVTDKIPANTEFVSAEKVGDVTPTFANNTVTWIVPMEPGDVKYCNFIVRVTSDNCNIVNNGILHVDDAEMWSEKVTNQAAKIIINKNISNYYANYGVPAFQYRITGSDGSVGYRMIKIDNQTNGQAVYTVPMYTAEGTTFTVEELRNARYEFVSLTAKTGDTNVQVVDATSPVGQTKKANVSFTAEKRTGEMTFTNRINDWDKASHADGVANNVD